MSEATDEVRWLSDDEMLAWRSYIVTTMMLRHRLHRELADEHDLSLTDYEVLVCLSGKPDRRMRMTELASMLGSTKSRLSHQVGRMECAGLVRRDQDSEDKRGVVAELTDEGQRRLEAAAPTHVAGVRGHVVDRLSEHEVEVMGAVFSRILAHLTEVEG